MKPFVHNAACLICFFWIGFFPPHPVYSYDGTSLPSDIVVRQRFEKGTGKPVGKILMVQGEGLIFHSDPKIGYHIRENLPIYEKDTIITLNRCRLRLEFQDKSILTLGAQTKMTIDVSMYDPSRKNRRSFLTMSFGKVRFYIRKMLNFERSEVKVRTRTAILGVRGSDFIVRATRDRTEVTALGDTVLDVISLRDVERPMVIEDFERAVIDLDELPERLRKISPEEVEELIRDLESIPDGVGPGEMVEIPRETGKKASGRTTEKDDKEIVSPGRESFPEEEAGPADAPASGSGPDITADTITDSGESIPGSDPDIRIFSSADLSTDFESTVETGSPEENPESFSPETAEMVVETVSEQVIFDNLTLPPLPEPPGR